MKWTIHIMADITPCNTNFAFCRREAVVRHIKTLRNMVNLFRAPRV